MKNVVITGAFGKSGSYMTRLLIENASSLSEYHFIFAVRETTNTSLLDRAVSSNLHYEYKKGDLQDCAFLQNLCNGVDILVHIAGIDKSLKLVAAAVNGNVKRLILVHTTGIYSRYKAAGEEYRNIENKISELLRNKNISITILRPTMIYGDLKDGNMSIFIKMVDKLTVFPVVDHAAYQLQPVWAKDLGMAYYSVFVNEKATANKSYILSGGAPIYLIDIFKTIATYLNRHNTFISVPFSIAYTGAWFVYICSLGKYDFREKVQRLVEPRTFSFEKAKNDFGYKPVIFQEGIKDEINMYLNSKMLKEDR